MIGSLHQVAELAAAPAFARFAEPSFFTPMAIRTVDLGGAGQPEVQAMALPLLAGMTSVTVSTAHLTIEAMRHEVERSVVATILGDAAQRRGVLINLGEEVRLTGFELASALLPGQHLLISAATNARGAWTFGPPLFAFPASAAPPLPGGMTADAALKRMTFPALTGRAWRIELLDADFIVTKVVLEELPHDLTVTANEDGETLVLWNHAGVLTPEQGKQDVDVRSMAERLLDAGQRLLSLEITSSTPARITIAQPPVEATWEAQPHDEPLRVALRGAWERLPLQPPPDLRPIGATLRVTARHLGRDRNSAAGVPTTSNAGLRVDRNGSVAVLAALEPLPDTPADMPVTLAAVRLFVMVFEAAEVVVELRAHSAGKPGEALAPQVVRRLAPQAGGWLEIEWPEPPSMATGPSAFWVVLRATRGVVLWCGDALADASRASSRVLVSADGGTSWAPPDAVLASPRAPALEVFHACVLPAEVSIDLRDGNAIVDSWPLRRAAPESREFTARGSLPKSVLDRFSRSPELTLRSSSALDVNVDEIVLSYDPNLV